MPRGDGTGPMGMGPTTGRAAGFCAGYEMPGYMNTGYGRGMGRGPGFRGCGGGRGWRNMFYATGMTANQRAIMPNVVTSPPVQELEILKQQAEYFGKTLEGIQNRIKDLESVPTGK